MHDHIRPANPSSAVLDALALLSQYFPEPAMKENAFSYQQAETSAGSYAKHYCNLLYNADYLQPADVQRAAGAEVAPQYIRSVVGTVREFKNIIQQAQRKLAEFSDSLDNNEARQNFSDADRASLLNTVGVLRGAISTDFEELLTKRAVQQRGNGYASKQPSADVQKWLTSLQAMFPQTEEDQEASPPRQALDFCHMLYDADAVRTGTPLARDLVQRMTNFAPFINHTVKQLEGAQRWVENQEHISADDKEKANAAIAGVRSSILKDFARDLKPQQSHAAAPSTGGGGDGGYLTKRLKPKKQSYADGVAAASRGAGTKR